MKQEMEPSWVQRKTELERLESRVKVFREDDSVSTPSLVGWLDPCEGEYLIARVDDFTEAARSLYVDFGEERTPLGSISSIIRSRCPLVYCSSCPMDADFTHLYDTPVEVLKDVKAWLSSHSRQAAEDFESALSEAAERDCVRLSF